MTLNDKIGNIIRDTHVMGADGLREYHAIQAVKSDMRIRDRFIRFASIKATLKNYRVMVNFTGDNKARIFNTETKTEVIL